MRLARPARRTRPFESRGETAAARASLDEVLAPLRKQFAATDISDEQLIADITEAQAEYRAEKAQEA